MICFLETSRLKSSHCWYLSQVLVKGEPPVLIRDEVRGSVRGRRVVWRHLLPQGLVHLQASARKAEGRSGKPGGMESCFEEAGGAEL